MNRISKWISLGAAPSVASLAVLASFAMVMAGCQKSDVGNSANKEILKTNPPLIDPPKASPTPDPKPEAPKKLSYTQSVEQQMQIARKFGFRSLTTGAGSGGSGGGMDPVYCGPGVDCQSKYIGVNLTSGDGSGGYCSGVLVAKDLVLTNRHCANVMVSDANQSFRGGMIQLVIPGADKSESYGPKAIGANVVMISPKDIVMPLGSPDWALIKVYDGIPLELPKGMQLPKINREGIIAGESYFIYSKSPYGDAADKNAIEKRECKAIYQTAFAPWFNTPKNAMVELADCPIGPGNSGAPIYNKSGELVGIIGGQFNPKLMNSLSALALVDYQLTTEMFQPVGWGMTLACIPNLDTGEKLPEECNSNLDQTIGVMPIPETLERQIRTVVDEAVQARPKSDRFKFETVRAENTNGLAVISQALFINIPSCVMPSAIAALADKTKVVQITVVGLKLSKFGELTGQVTTAQTMLATIDVDTQALQTTKSAKMTLSISGLPMHQGTLKICD